MSALEKLASSRMDTGIPVKVIPTGRGRALSDDCKCRCDKCKCGSNCDSSDCDDC